jgi:hypothetical protein
MKEQEGKRCSPHEDDEAMRLQVAAGLTQLVTEKSFIQ